MLDLSPWDWFGFGVVFLVLELLINGVFLFWVGLAAITVSLFLFTDGNISWQWQLFIFGAATLLYVLGWTYLGGGKENNAEDEASKLNTRTNDFIGKVRPLTEAIVAGRGAVSIDDTRWTVEGPEAPIGQAVKVIEISGNVLKVELVASNPESI